MYVGGDEPKLVELIFNAVLTILAHFLRKYITSSANMSLYKCMDDEHI